MQVRYDEKKGIYRDCKWCHGEGCAFCPGEAEKEYKKQFPNGPQPIATFPNTPDGAKEAVNFINNMINIINDRSQSLRPKPCEKCGTEPNVCIINGEPIWTSECSNCGYPLSVQTANKGL